MMHLFLNSLAASAGSGLTYLRNVVPQLSDYPGLQTTVAASSALREELGSRANISFVEAEVPESAARRFYWEQTCLPGLIRASGADVLLSTGNFALRRSPAPQILLAGNSLYVSKYFSSDLLRRRAYGMWLDNRIRAHFACRSIHWADCTVAPSRAFAEQLRRWARGRVTSVYHGFDERFFFNDPDPLPEEFQAKLDAAQGDVRLLFVSHYNYYRNFETLLRAIPLLCSRLGHKRIKLFLTCRLRSQDNPGRYRAENAAALVRRLGIADQVVELGAIPYRQLHRVYRACDIYVTPAYAETFAHPLVEAMACGMPIVASDLPVHREVCGDAARYFSRFSSEDLAEAVARVCGSSEVTAQLAKFGRERSRQFSWRSHVDQIVRLARELCEQSTVALDKLTPTDSVGDQCSVVSD